MDTFCIYLLIKISIYSNQNITIIIIIINYKLVLYKLINYTTFILDLTFNRILCSIRINREKITIFNIYRYDILSMLYSISLIVLFRILNQIESKNYIYFNHKNC